MLVRKIVDNWPKELVALGAVLALASLAVPSVSQGVLVSGVTLGVTGLIAMLLDWLGSGLS